MKLTYTLFDVLYLLAAAVVYFSATSAAVYCASWLWGESALAKASALCLGYFLFLHFFVLVIGLLRLITQPRLREGTFPIGFNKDYVAWGINSIYHGIMNASPFAQQVYFIFYLNRLYLLMMGMKLPASSMIGTGTSIRQPELIELGTNSTIGIHSTISGHYSPNRKKHCHGKTIIGNDTIIGGASKLLAPVTIGNNVVVGACCELFPKTTVGDNCRLGPSCTLAPGARIPDNVTLRANTYISHEDKLQEGETWAGNPAVRIGVKQVNAKEKA